MTAVVTVAQALKEGWLENAARLRCGLLKRPVPGVPHMNLKQHPEYELIVHELDQFIEWLMWFETPKKLRGRRPEVWRRVPRWAWTVWGEYEVAHPKPPPAPPPPPTGDNPPSRWKNAPWTRGKYVAISHGLRWNDGVWTIDQLIQRLQASGTKSVSPQFGADNPDPDWAENIRRLYKAAKAVGIPCWPWGRADYADWPTVRDAIRSIEPIDGLALDVEQRCQDQQLPEHVFGEFGGRMPLAVVATGGIDDAFGNGAIESAKRFGPYFDFLGQDYKKESLPLTPAGGENFVHWRSTDKNGGKGYRHLPDAKNRWHIPQGMSDAETCPSMEAQRADWKDWSPFIGWWDGEIIESNNEWGVWASL